MNDQPDVAMPTGEATNVLERVIDGVLNRVLPHVDARTIYGEPIVRGDLTIVPVGRVSYRFGFGGGGGKGGAQGEGEGSGGGGGGSLEVIPVGYIEMGTEARFVPVIDRTKIALAGLRVIAPMAASIAEVTPPGADRPVHGADAYLS